MTGIVGTLYTIIRFSVFQFPRNQACLSVEEERFRRLLYQAVNSIRTSHPMRKCKAVRLAVPLVSVFNYGLRIICDIYT